MSERTKPRGDRSLGQWLWDELEAPQGYSFVSDDMCSWSDAQVLAFVQRNISNVHRVARLFDRIDRDYELVPDERA